MGLGTKTYWLTDHQLQCDFDSEVRQIRQEDVIQGSSLVGVLTLKVL
jgi:hypothetical protein